MAVAQAASFRRAAWRENQKPPEKSPTWGTRLAVSRMRLLKKASNGMLWFGVVWHGGIGSVPPSGAVQSC